jgi:hypothetical protein
MADVGPIALEPLTNLIRVMLAAAGVSTVPP